MVAAITLLLGCQLVGELVVAATGLPLPGPVLGMVILFVGLVVKGGIPQPLAEVSDTLLRNLSLLFVPAGVGVMLHLALIEREWLAVSAALVGSTAVTIVATALVMTWLRRVAGANDAEGGT